jgi:GNAT superfamily N-acetyltransferase
MSYTIASIADHLDLVPIIARWHWAEWGHLDPEGSLEAWTAGLARRTNRNAVDALYIALADGRPVGSATLAAQDMSTHMELTPWLSGLYVLPSFRRQGIGRALAAHVAQQAADLGIPALYLYTGGSEGFYRRLGWEPISIEPYAGAMVTIMRLLLEQSNENG